MNRKDMDTLIALKHCATEGSSCSGCLYYGSCIGDIFTIERDAADLIERQDAENERLRREVSALREENDNYKRLEAERYD